MTKPAAAIRTIKNLIVIESAGKIPALQAALKKSRIDDFHIIATAGHLFDLPTSLMEVGIDRHVNEYARRPKRTQQIDGIQNWAKNSQRVLLACDADQEGDVLAWDIVQLLDEIGHKNVARVRLRALDSEGVLHAFMHPEPVRFRDAWPGTTRRMLDRLIGCTYASRETSFLDLSVGRVQSALLGAAAKENIAFGEAKIVLPCCDRKEPFVATIPIYAHNFKQVEELMVHAKEFAASGQCVPFGKSVPAENFKPWGFGQAVMALSEATGRPIDDVTKSLQRLYENGRMSYPRSDAASITAQGIASIQKMADQHGVRFDASMIPTFSRMERHAHESPRPLQSNVNITAPLLIMNDDEAALSLISRHLVACGQPHAVHSPSAASLPAWAAGLKFERKVCQWLRPWPKKTLETSMRMIPKEEIALSLLLRHKLGRPSTVVFHALKFASRELLDNQARLLEKGGDWIKRTPSILQDPQTSRQIEMILNACVDEGKYNESPQMLVKTLLQSINIWDDVQEMLKKSDALRPQNSGMGTGI